jgi:predicted nucleic acid-binding Zn ribbon protein
MPTHGCSCQACGFKQNCLQRTTDVSLVDCPEFGKKQFTKQMMVSGFACQVPVGMTSTLIQVFKKPGW